MIVVEDSADVLYMAPMLGLTDSAYRTAFTECYGGFDCAITPFIKTLQGGRCKDSKITDFLPSRNKVLPIFPQILSNNCEDFIAVAKEVHDLGYEKININFGCPVPMAAGRGRGAGLLPHPEFVDSFLDTVLAAIPNQLSIKTRVGFDRDDQLLVMAKVFNRYPLYEVAIHPRTALQGYGGSVNHEAFALVAAELKTSIIYSGDLNSVDDFIGLKARYPSVRKWMLGRGALANPLLPQLIRRHLGQGIPGTSPPRLAFHELVPFYRNFAFQLAQRQYEPNIVLSRLKSLFYYHVSHFGCDKHLVKAARKANGLEAFLKVLA